MDTIWAWGLEVIAALQSVRTPLLDLVFRGFSQMGEEFFFLLLLPVIFWLIDVRLGARVGILLLLSFLLNHLLKEAIHHPRPADLNPAVALIQVDGYGLPSGHAQSAMGLCSPPTRGPP